MRVGIFGGTFDPIHLGHLILAEQCREQGRLDQVWFLPAPRPPHKADRPVTRFEQRVEMLHLAIAGHAAFRVEEIENERPGLSYTVDTIEELRRRQPNDELFLLIGSDTLAQLHTWHEPVRLLASAGLIVRARPTYPVAAPADVRMALRMSPEIPLRMEVVQAPVIEISSHDLRARAVAGRSLRYFVPRAVEEYVREKRLYRADVV